MTQSNVIVKYLEEVYPDPPFCHQDPYSASIMRTWMHVEQDYLFDHAVTLSFNTMMKLRVEGFGLKQLQE